jgi:hypothetical protein
VAVTSLINTISHNGNGVTVAFAIPYYFLLDTDIEVIVGGVTKTLNVDYTVSGAGIPAGGTAFFVVPPVVGVGNVVINRTPAITQSLDTVNNQKILTKNLDNALDRGIMISQRLEREIGDVSDVVDDIAIQAMISVYYLGAKSADPTLDNQGNALLVGALYFNTVSNVIKVWNGVAWVLTLAPATGGALLASLNLADLSNLAAAQTNFGGTAVGKALWAAANAAAAQATIGLAIGTNVQAYNAALTIIQASALSLHGSFL